MALKLYGLNKCSTCGKARSWLDERGIAHEFTDYRDHPLEANELAAWARSLGGWTKLVNRGSLTWRNLPEDRKDPQTDAEWQQLIAEYPTLIRRPVVWDGATVGVGYSEKKFEQRFG